MLATVIGPLLFNAFLQVRFTKKTAIYYFPIMPDNVGEQEPFFHAESSQ